ncbi:MAG: ATP-grasp domain-containing protein [Spirochaetota bacterium]
MSRTILILGAGVMQLPSIRAARRLGLHVIVADANTQAVGISEADEYLPVDLKDERAMADAARAIKERRGLHAVFTAGTDFSATVAYVVEQLQLPGTRHEAALNATDKFRMRGVLREAGVNVPDFAVLSRRQIEETGCAEATGSVSLPVVVKPVDSMGARGVVRADRWDEAERYARKAVAFSRSGRVVVEQYIDGPEFSLDAVVYGDDIQITGFADRHIRFPPYFIEVGHTIPTAIGTEEQNLVVGEFRKAVRALGIGPGAAKGDVKLSGRRAVIGEVAARLSGGYMSGWTYPLSSGVPLSEIGIRVALGEVPPRAHPRWERTSAERAVISIPGVLRDVRGVDAVRSADGVEELFIARSPGEQLTFPRNNVEKVGNVIAVADGRDEAIAAAESAVRLLEAVLEPDNRETDHFLFADAETAGDRDGDVPVEYRNWAYSGLSRFAVNGDLMRTWRVLRSQRRGTLEVELPEVVAESAERDWAYRSIGETVETLAGDRLLRFRVVRDRAPRNDVSRLVTRALLKGGLQGVRYVRDTLEHLSTLNYTPDS